MADIFSKRKRSDIMSRVRSKGNKATELAMVTLFRTYDITGWRRHSRIFGNPDFVFPSHRVALFVDGCFWHSCPTHGSEPASNREFWKRKLQRNKTRDELVTATLEQRGWLVLRVWQHDILRRAERRLAKRIGVLLQRRARSVSDRKIAPS